ncbi:MAG: WD40 repeat domain-containing protein [Anaerolineae bacterium]|nr:WD40 repeat domain-containing protein [Anaerolineae bacterium]
MKLSKAPRLIILLLTFVVIMSFASQTVMAQAEGIIATAWSPDGSKIAVSGVSGLLQIRDIYNQPIRTLTGLSSSIWAVDWSPDSTKIVTGSDDGQVIVWNIATGQQLGSLIGLGNYVQDVDWSPDGSKILATGENSDTLFVWNASTFQQLASINAGNCYSAEWSPDSTKIVAGNGIGYVNIFSASLGNPITSYSVDGGVEPVSWSSDGTKIAGGVSDIVNNTYKIVIWDYSTGTVSATYSGHTDQVSGVEFSPNGQQIASASYDGTVRVWNVATGLQIGSFTKPQSFTTSIAWSPDSSQLAFGGTDATLEIVAAPVEPMPTPTHTPTATNTP